MISSYNLENIGVLKWGVPIGDKIRFLEAGIYSNHSNMILPIDNLMGFYLFLLLQGQTVAPF